MNDLVREMTDIVFPVSGHALPANYAFLLWQEAVRVLPWLTDEPAAGILPMHQPESPDCAFLSKRARMVLRVPVNRVQEARNLSGQVLDVGEHEIALGEARERPLHPHATLHAQLVASEAREEGFMKEVAAGLAGLGIGCQSICGRGLVLPGSEGRVAGYSLVVHELKPEDSLRLQWAGLGSGRHFGCGIFVPYKVIGQLE